MRLIEFVIVIVVLTASLDICDYFGSTSPSETFSNERLSALLYLNHFSPTTIHNVLVPFLSSLCVISLNG